MGAGFLFDICFPDLGGRQAADTGNPVEITVDACEILAPFKCDMMDPGTIKERFCVCAFTGSKDHQCRVKSKQALRVIPGFRFILKAGGRSRERIIRLPTESLNGMMWCHGQYIPVPAQRCTGDSQGALLGGNQHYPAKNQH